MPGTFGQSLTEFAKFRVVIANVLQNVDADGSIPLRILVSIVHCAFHDSPGRIQLPEGFAKSGFGFDGHHFFDAGQSSQGLSELSDASPDLHYSSFQKGSKFVDQSGSIVSGLLQRVEL